ncbi:ATP-binding cassette domain-containing protein [Streptomyces sp. SID5785]|uniref:ABC transporter ATP-binding protein n=1 Tax=Streptomyces sp. SID5785 TaxID=2690309 RepID=UPI001361AE94|nr:ABC transporter ATP-binding protein [Streptomyces sp. SID5785]MZD08376.1 ATP-binding cassette domain-containing protein [Streptomyces sp. SID5785]
MTGADAVRLTGVTHTLGGTTVLDGVNLTLERGAFVCVVGGSGCGKSTLLNVIAGLDTPVSGTVHVPGGRPSLMFQEHALFPWLTAGRNIEFALRRTGTPKSELRARSQELLDLVRLPQAYGRRVHELSGGMRQRVALARALARGSDVLLMDEPFAALDAVTRDVLHDELTRVWTTRRPTVLFVTHDVHEAVRLGQRVVLMAARPGRIAHTWDTAIPYPRHPEDPAVTAAAREITRRLHRELAPGHRHAGAAATEEAVCGTS